MNLDILKQVVERCNNGESVMSLCREYNLKRHTLYSYCKRNGIILKSKFVYKPFKNIKQDREKIVNEYRNGQGCISLARKYGVNHHTILRYMREFDVKARTVEDNRAIKGKPIVNMFLNAYKKSEAAKRLGFSLSYEDCETLMFQNCYYCGSKPINKRAPKSYDEYYNGIDRIDSSRGYAIDNVVTSCFRCNSAKNNMTLIEFKDWIKKLLDNDVFEKLDNLIKRG